MLVPQPGGSLTTPGNPATLVTPTPRTHSAKSIAWPGTTKESSNVSHVHDHNHHRRCRNDLRSRCACRRGDQIPVAGTASPAHRRVITQEEIMNASVSVLSHKVVSQEEWLAARRDLLREEKALTKQQQRVAAARRELPWVKITKNYVFDTPNGKVRLTDLFDGPQPVHRQALHAGARPEGRLRRLLVRDRSPSRERACIWSTTTYRSSPSRARRWPRSRRLRSAWAGRFPGSPRSSSDFNYDFHVSFTPKQIARRRGVLQLRGRAHSGAGSVRLQRVLQGRQRRHLPHLRDLRTRRGGT